MAKRIIYFLPLFIFLFFVFLKTFYPSFYDYSVQEDKVVENLQFLIFFITSIIFFAKALRTRKANKLFAIFCFFASVCLFFIAMEEISWGQRIFKFGTPQKIEEKNFQDEFTFHNLSAFHKILHFVYIGIGIIGGTAWMIIPRKIFKKNKFLKQFIPGWYLTFYFILVAFVYFIIWIADIQSKIGFIYWKDQEPAELILALGFLFYSLFLSES